MTNGLSLSDSRYRSAAASIKIGSSWDISLDGLLGKKPSGMGEILYGKLDPNSFHAYSLSYQRFTRWRSIRASVHIAANLGASLKCDLNIFRKGKKVDSHPSKSRF